MFLLTLALLTAPLNLPLVDFAAPGVLDTIGTNHTELKLVDAADGGKALEVAYRTGYDWPNVSFSLGKAFSDTDWSNAGALLVTITNPADEPLTLMCRIDDESVNRGTRWYRQGPCNLPAKSTVTVMLSLASGIPGMRGQPPIAGDPPRFAVSGQELDTAHIVAFQFFLARPTEEHTLVFRDLKLVPVNRPTKFVDPFGQYNGADWPGKVHDEAEFAAQRAAEEQDLEAHPGPAGRNPWGGWADGPQRQATGRFRTEKLDGQWWLIDPDGRLFWSAGITCVRPDSSGPTKGRQDLFTWLPPEGSPLREFFNGDWYNPYGANLSRKYGADWRQAWSDVTHRRLHSWGLTTIGNWSDGAVCNLDRTAYTVPVNPRDVPALSREWKKHFPDVFTDVFATKVDEAMAAAAKDRVDDPWCIGYFIQNELSWNAGGGPQPMANSVLKLGADVVAKQRLVQLLKERHATVEALNQAWGTSIPSWDELASGVTLDKDQRTTAQDDLSAFETLFAERYFSVCQQAVRKHAPGALYLGSRFSNSTPEAVQAAGKYCDVVSFNIYNRTPNARAEAATLVDKPVVIGEFHFGALDRGKFHTGLGPTESQTERAECYTNYVTDALGAPWCVGAHWFQYVDQPLTGRFDGENYNIGFVSITDTPYPELIGAARGVLDNLYQTRAAAGGEAQAE